MADIDSSLALIHGNYDTVENLWNHEIDASQVFQFGKTTTITYSLLQLLPSYYDETKQSDPDGFQSVDLSKPLAQDINYILGASSQTGFETFYQDVAFIVFSNVSNATNADNVGAITFAQFDPSIVTDNNGQTNIASGFEQTAAWQINFLSSVAMQDQVGDIWLNKTQISNPALGAGDNTQFAIVLHEIGHALGLEHSSASPGGDELSPHLSGEENTVKYTIMIPGDDHGSATFNHPDMYYGPDDSPYKYTTSLGLYDVAAIQTIYGRNYDARSDDTTYDADHGLSHDAFTYTIWDGGGTDTIDASAYQTPVEIDLRQGHFSSIGSDGNPNGEGVAFDDQAFQFDDPSYDAGNVAIAFYTIIENAYGTNNTVGDTLIGNSWGNVLYGADGNDLIYGDGIVYDGDAGFQEANTLPDASGVVLAWGPDGAPDENNSGNDVLIGGKGNDVLYGGAGDDILEGGFNRAFLNQADPDWNAAGQFYGIADLAQNVDGMDTADYSKDPAGITIHWNADGTLTVTDGYGGADTLDSIEKIVGATGNGLINTLQVNGAGTLEEVAPGHYQFNGHDLYLDNVTRIAGDDADQIFRLTNLPKDGIDGGPGGDTLTLQNATGVVYNPNTNQLYFGSGDIRDASTVMKNIEHFGIDSGINDYSGVDAPQNFLFSTNHDSYGYNYGTDFFGVNWFHRTVLDSYYTNVPTSIGSPYDSFAGYASSYEQYNIILQSEQQWLNGHQLQVTMHGSNKGDTYDINLNGRVFTLLNITTGFGDDTINVTGKSATAHVTYTAGNDVIHGDIGNLIMASYISPHDVSISYSGSAEFIGVAGYGSIFIDGITTPVTISYANIDTGIISHGTSGNDFHTAMPGQQETYLGDAGNDIITGGGAHDVLYGGNGYDTLRSFSGVNELYGDADDDQYIVSKNALTTIFDYEGNNTLTLTDWNQSDLTVTMRNFDIVAVDSNLNPVLIIQAGTTLSDIVLSDGTHMTLTALRQQAQSSHITLPENQTTPFSDLIRIYYSDAPITLHMGSGYDTYDGHTTDVSNIIYGEDDEDYIYTGSADDQLYGGNGRLDVLDGGAGNDLIDGGAGANDTVQFGSYIPVQNGVVVDLAAGQVINDGFGDHDTLVSIEQALATPFDDILSGDNGDNLFLGNGGSDVMTGLGGNDFFGVGNLQGQDNTGNHSIIDGGDGIDTVSFSQGLSVSYGNVTANLQLGTSTDGQGGTETLISIENIRGSILGGDDLTGSDVANRIELYASGIAKGLGGDDVLTAVSGDVTLMGGDGNDILIGGTGNDILIGGAGNDRISGGAGNDTYVFSPGDGLDTISDTQGINTISVQGGITLNDLVMTQAGNNLVVHIASGITIANFFDPDNQTVFNVSFTDGSIYNLADVPLNNHNPVAQDDNFMGVSNIPITGNILVDNGYGMDTDPDGNALYTIAGTSITENGGLFSIDSNGNFTYASAQDYIGPDNIQYTVNDGVGGEATATVQLTIFPQQTPLPIAKDDNFSFNEDTLLQGNVLADNGNGADVIPAGSFVTITAQNVVTAQGGIVDIHADGSFTYTPTTNFNGPDSFTYSETDPGGNVATASVNINVAPVNDVPEAKPDDFAGTQDHDIEGNLLADNGHGADYDLDGDVLKVVQNMITSAAGGSVILMANGDFVYMPPAGFTGTDSFDYTVMDNNGGTATATAILGIAALPSSNHNPVAEADSFAGHFLDSISGNVIHDNGHGVDHDADDNTLSVQGGIIQTANGGVVTLNVDGTYVYTPTSGFIGQDSFSYTLKDGQGGSSTGLVTLNITPRADQITGTAGNDTLTAATNHDTTIAGFAGNDKITGKGGNDILIGGQGNDTIKGGAGNDTIIGDDVLVSKHLYSADNILYPKTVETVNIANLNPDGTPNLGIIHGDLSSNTAQTATITFVQTVAGYNNSLGSYLIGPDGTIHSASLEFANVKNYQAGETATLHLPGSPDSDFGFFIISDGARANHDYTGLNLTGDNLTFYYNYGQTDQRLADIHDSSDHISLVYNDGTTTKILQGDIYHTTERGSSDLNINPDHQIHAISGLEGDGNTDTLRIGFEDLKGTGDADYNDVVFDIKINPAYHDAGTVGGNDTLYGGAGADTFVFTTNGGIDTVKDFHASEGDRLDISNLIKDYDPVDDIIAQFVHMEQQGTSQVLSVDNTGTGQNFQTVAILENSCGLKAEDLVHSGNLVV